MKKFKIVVFSLSLLSFQINSSSYFFKQVGFSIASGAAAGLVFKEERDNVLALGSVASYVALKFFYDVLSAQRGTDIVKGFVSVPLNAGVTAFACLVAKSAAK